MSATLPLVTLGLVLSAFVPVSPAAVTKPAGDKLLCSYSANYFRVTDGVQKWEKYIGNWDNKLAKVECGEKIAAGLIGSYFVFFSNGKIKDKYIGSFPEERRLLALDGEIAAAVNGAYFITARAGGEIVDHFAGSSSEKPAIAISKNFAAAVIGSYFVIADGMKTTEKYVSSGTDSKLTSNDSMAAAMMGSYFVGFSQGRILEKYIGARALEDMIVAAPALIAASFGNYFVVLDNRKGEIVQKYIGSPGKVQAIRNIAVHMTADGRVTNYDTNSGQFSDE